MSGEGRIKFSRVYEGLLREAFLFAGRGNRAYRTHGTYGTYRNIGLEGLSLE